MAIEGPLRELGIHDVFQLLDLSRKTGALRVTSELRDNEGTVHFDSGKVVYASIRSNPHPLGAMLVRTGKVSEADLERALSLQAQRQDGREGNGGENKLPRPAPQSSRVSFPMDKRFLHGGVG